MLIDTSKIHPASIIINNSGGMRKTKTKINTKTNIKTKTKTNIKTKTKTKTKKKKVFIKYNI